MDKKIQKIILFLVIIFVFFLGYPLGHGFAYLPTSKVLALEIHYPSIPGLPPLNDTTSLPGYVCYIFGLLTNLAIFIAVIAIAFGGVYYLVSYGRGKFTSEGKDWIKAGVLGLLVVVCASLIAYTINPNLTTCKLGFLPQINFNFLSNSTTLPGVTVTTYQEIPIGTLTETLLTRTMDCFGFDQSGDPIDGDEKTKDVIEPIYSNHDRADCLAQLIDGAQKKARVVDELSKAVTSLMNQCSCEGKCKPINPICDLTVAPEGRCSCGGPCDKCQPTAACEAIPGDQIGGDCCMQASGPINPITGKPSTYTSLRGQIEHGPISVAVDVGANSASNGDCKTEAVEYKGLDEFRCPNPKDSSTPCSDIPHYVEKQRMKNNKLITVIDQEKWEKLNLLQQLTYFKEKISNWAEDSGIKNDKDVLDQAKTTLGNCYLATPYVDLLKTYQSTKQTEQIILTQKTFSDPQTGNKIDASKYCQGFNYDNSSCLKKCNDACPDTSGAAVGLYQQCGECRSGDTNCLKSQEACIEKAYNSRPCIYGKGGTFASCITSCQDDCTTNCDEKYLPCSNENDFCKSQCNDNSQCVLDNADSCLFNSANFQQCASQTTDQGNTNYCINNAYLCKNGSNEYAGYPDCVEPSSVKCSSFADQGSCEGSTECIWDGGKCSQNYSASFFYNNPNSQKCPNPYNAPIQGTACYSSEASSNTSCQDLCPETTKCPASSYCPNCPCDQIDQTLSFSIPNQTWLTPSTCPGPHAQNPSNYTLTQQISAHEIVGPQCNGYSYNDDPLTFYCETNPPWWIPTSISRKGLSNTPLGNDYKVDLGQEGEIPVGQTVDNAENWADKIINSTNSTEQDIKKIIDQIIKIGKAKDTDPVKNYCRCNAQFENNDPVCTTDCFPTQAGCFLAPCGGNSCLQIVDYFANVSYYDRQLELDFIDFYTTMLKEPRSDIMKELTYSRQTTNDCSLINSAYGSDAKLLSCTRAKAELVSPISTGKITLNGVTMNGCYGGQGNGHLGEIFNLTDNWFCAEKYSKTSTK